tara:strand:+ start:206 stop:361 length:156 start_codon:yes stop_codon:yes gene_type:complete
MIRIVNNEGKIVYETDNLHKVVDELLFQDYTVKEIIVNINYDMVEDKYGRI